MNHLKEQNVLILGLGISGLSMARWCARQGARVTVADTRERRRNCSACRTNARRPVSCAVRSNAP
jgi:UDP-N-acetylmuramoylalanine--D-glutamate ligase